jgi:6-phosphofructokinase 1
MNIKKIAITTGGGDAPGLNGVIRAVTLAATKRGWDCVGIREGFDGMLYPDQFEEDGGIVALTPQTVRGISHTGGTILGTANRGNPFSYSVQSDDGSVQTKDLSDRLVAGFESNNIDALVAIGGDGTMAIACQVAKLGIKVVGVPKTIDNDLDGTVATFGFDTAVSYATDAIGRLHTTAASHNRVMIVEVMGRYAGWIALEAGLAGSADVILIPEIPFDLDKVVTKIQRRNQHRRKFSIISIAEGAMPLGGEASYKEVGGVKNLGGMGDWLAESLRGRIENQVRTVVLGHLLRGGSPTSRDRLLSLRFGAAAVRALQDNHFNVMVGLDPPTVRHIPLEEATKNMKTVPLDCDMILTARDLGTCLGD